MEQQSLDNKITQNTQINNVDSVQKAYQNLAVMIDITELAAYYGVLYI